MVSFVYMVSDEDYSPIFVLEAEEPFISGLKDGKTFRYIKDESEISDYIKKFPLDLLFIKILMDDFNVKCDKIYCIFGSLHTYDHDKI